MIGKQIFLLGLALAMSAEAAATTQSRVRNLMPDYWRFLDRAKQMPAGSQQAWTQYYFKPNQKILADVQCPTLASGRLPVSGSQLARLESSMRRASATLSVTMPAALERFDRYFPDNAWRGNIYIMSSLGCFDGRAQSIAGQPVMLLGIDVIASTDNPDPAVLLTHELFHLYHRQHFKPQNDRLWVSLWSEGLATYASEVLNPGASTKALLLPGALMDAVDRDRAKLVADLASKLDESNGRAETLYFRTDDRTEPVPPRAGYYLGLLVARAIAAQGYDLRTMARWDALTAEPLIRSALLGLQGSGSDSSAKS